MVRKNKKSNNKEAEFNVANSEVYSLEFLNMVLSEAKEHLRDIDTLYELNKRRINTIYQIVIPLIAGLIFLLKEEKSIQLQIFFSITIFLSLGFLWWNTIINNYILASMQGYQPKEVKWENYETLSNDQQEKKLIIEMIELYQSKLTRNLQGHYTTTKKIAWITKAFIWISTIQVIAFIIFKWLG